MSPVKTLIKFLESQDHVPVEAEDYTSTRDYEITTNVGPDGDTHIRLDEQRILFVFDRYERFLGIVNLK